jgi:hypothetical protein
MPFFFQIERRDRNATGEKKTDVVISNRDAQVILTTAPYTGYLKNGRVMVVYD